MLPERKSRVGNKWCETKYLGLAPSSAGTNSANVSGSQAYSSAAMSLSLQLSESSSVSLGKLEALCFSLKHYDTSLNTGVVG